MDGSTDRVSEETTNPLRPQDGGNADLEGVTPDNVADVISVDQLMEDVTGTLVAIEQAYAEGEGITLDAEAVSVLVSWLRSNAGVQVALIDELARLTAALEETTGPTRTAAGLVLPD